MTYAKIICDSINTAGDRLTTFEVRLHRFVLAELNTHRAFSRNSASSRAIPVAKQIDRIMKDPADPISWPAEQKGMQGGEEFSPEDELVLRGIWGEARDYATLAAGWLTEAGLHKSVTNRVLEPFMWHTAVISATDLNGFWEQRCSPLAQPEIRAAAEAMWVAYDDSTPELVHTGDWHMPYLDEVTRDAADHDVGVLGRVSVARCARVSYLTQAGIRDIAADLELYDRLVSAKPAHWSPLEHVATPDLLNVMPVVVSGVDFTGKPYDRSFEVPLYGNFRGWRQHRAEMEAA